MRKLFLFTACTLLFLVISACGSDTSTKEVETISIASWSQPISEQINLLSEDIDFFNENQLEIEFIPGAGGGDAIKNIVSGQADVAFTDAGSFFSALDQGEDLIALYNIYPQNVFNVVSLKDRNITEPSQLKGKKIGVYSLASGTRQNLLVLLKQVGLSEDDVEIIETGVLNFAPLMQGQVDATAATDTGLVTALSKGLGEINLIEVKDYFNYSSDMFVVTRETYEEKEELLARFLQAYKQSVKWMMDTPEEAAKDATIYAIDGKDEANNLDVIKLRNDAALPLSGDLAELGMLDVTNFQDAADLYYELGLIKQKLEIGSAIIDLSN